MEKEQAGWGRGRRPRALGTPPQRGALAVPVWPGQVLQQFVGDSGLRHAGHNSSESADPR